MPCRPPTALLLHSISEGLSDGLALEDAVLVEVVYDRPSERFMPSHFVAGFISGAQPTRVAGLWAVGITGNGSITALNDAARELSDWGLAARPGSTAEKARHDALTYPEAREALDCLESV